MRNKYIVSPYICNRNKIGKDYFCFNHCSAPLTIAVRHQSEALSKQKPGVSKTKFIRRKKQHIPREKRNNTVTKKSSLAISNNEDKYWNLLYHHSKRWKSCNEWRTTLNLVSNPLLCSRKKNSFYSPIKFLIKKINNNFYYENFTWLQNHWYKSISSRI